MICIILAAGKGTRLAPLTDTTPKPLLMIGEKTILAHTIEQLPDEITRVVLMVKHLGDKIKEHFGKKWAGKRITYVTAVSLKGTADMIRQSKKYVKGKTLVLMGDDLYKKEDLEALIGKPREGEWAILAKEVENAKEFGVLKFNDAGNLCDIIERPEKPSSNFINAGAYIIDEQFFRYSLAKLANGEYGLPQTMLQARKDIVIHIVKADFWIPINTLENYERARKVYSE